VNSSVALAVDADSVGSGVAESVTAGALLLGVLLDGSGVGVAAALDDVAADVGLALGEAVVGAPVSARPQPASTAAAAARQTEPVRRLLRTCVTGGR